MTPERLEALLEGAQETDSVDFKAPMPWNRNTFTKDILAMSNVIDGGAIIIGVEDGSFKRLGVSKLDIETYDIDIMRDQIAPFADPRVHFTRQILEDSLGLEYVVIEVSPFEEIPVVCARGGQDVREGDIYFRSRARRPSSERVSRSEDMREIIEASIVRRSRGLRRIGFVPDLEEQRGLDEELGGL